MKKLDLTCPKCNSNNARQWNRTDTHFFDDDFYSFLKETYGDTADTENYYNANCICDDCGHHFDVKVFIDVQVTGMKYLDTVVTK